MKMNTTLFWIYVYTLNGWPTEAMFKTRWHNGLDISNFLIKYENK